jgi:exosortase/archaeosortase family protein
LAFALCIGAAFVIKRPLWEKLVLILSAAPIAVAANVTRIVLTALLYEAVYKWPAFLNIDTAHKIIHNGAGYVMPIFGLLYLWLEMFLLSKLLQSPLPERPLIAGRLMTDRDSKEKRMGNLRN